MEGWGVDEIGQSKLLLYVTCNTFFQIWVNLQVKHWVKKCDVAQTFYMEL